MTINTAAGSSIPAAAGTPVGSAKTAPQNKRWSRQVACDISAIADGLAVFMGAGIPAAIYGSVGNVVTNWVLLAQTSFAASLIAHLCLRFWKQYDPNRIYDFPLSPAAMLGAVAIGVSSMSGLGLPHALQGDHIWIWCVTWMSASFTFLVMTRGLAQAVLKHMTATGLFDERVAVFGAGSIARRVHDHFMSPSLGIRFAGVFDDRVGEDRLNPEGLAVAGKLADLVQRARNDEIDRIIIALPQAAGDRIAIIARKLAQLPVSVHIVTHIASDLMEAQTIHQVSNLGPVGLLDVKPKPLSGWGPMVKRMEDRVLGTLLLLTTAPVFPFIALAIKAESTGPVFFQQSRRGLNRRIFKVIKFRTMHKHVSSPDLDQAKPGDARITYVGAILRRLSIDELPQLINVLKGDMSLVGPRPHAIVHDDKFSEELEDYANRHQVKPGMTGLAQVRGYRGETSTPEALEARVNADMEYIKTWSLGLDLSILVRTVSAVLTGKNAH